MSTYSPNLRIELITTGTQAGTWGTTTNTNLGTLIEDAISGYTAVSVTSANQALTAINGAADQSRNMSIALTTTTGANFAVYAPPAEKLYVVYNASSYTATIYNSTVLGNTTAAGTGVAIPAGKAMTVWSDGTNFAVQNSHIIGTVVGNVTGNVTGNLTGNVTGDLNGNLTATAPTAATAIAGTDTTQIATTAFVQTAATPKADKTTTISAGTGLSGGGDLSANRTLAIANTGVTANSYGSSTAVPVLTVNAQGQITAATTAAISLPTGAGTVSNGGSFTATTGPSGACLIDVVVGVVAGYGNFGGGTVSVIIGGSTVGTSTVNTMEYSSRYSGDHGRVAYRYTGSANSSVSVTVSYSGPGSYVEGSYSFIGT